MLQHLVAHAVYCTSPSATRPDSHGEDTKLLSLPPKFHLWIESSEYQTQDLGSPRYYWCYKDEDLSDGQLHWWRAEEEQIPVLILH